MQTLCECHLKLEMCAADWIDARVVAKDKFRLAKTLPFEHGASL